MELLFFFCIELFIVFICLLLVGIIIIISLFFSQIMLFDRLALAILSSVLSYGLLHTHPAISIVIGIVVFLLLSKLQYTKIGFWTISGLLSLFLGFVFSLMTYRIAEKDMIWTCVVFGLVTLIVFRLHIHAQNKIDKV